MARAGPIRRRGEDALLAERRPAPQVRAYFAKQPPGTPAGRVALAFALKADGIEQEASDRIRHVWREDNFGHDWSGASSTGFRTCCPRPTTASAWSGSS